MVRITDREDLKEKIREIINYQLKLYYPNAVDKIDSFSEISRKLGRQKSTLVKYLLKEILGEFKYKEIFTDRLEFIGKLKRHRLNSYLDYQFNRYFPDNVEKIFSVGKFARLLGKNRKQVREWIHDFIKEKFTYQPLADQVYKDIWLSKSTIHRRMNYDIILLAVKNFGYEIVTTRKEYEDMDEIPSMRIIYLKCNEGHNWYVRSSVLLYLGTECPGCGEKFKCQTIMRLFMEKIFNTKFPETSLSQACSISGEKLIRVNGRSYIIQRGRLSFDGYNARVFVNGKYFKIAFEYDGRHHDDKNHYYYTRYGSDYFLVRAWDKLKSIESKKAKICIIRLKEVDGFKLSTIHTFQHEIIKQFEELTSENLQEMPQFRYDDNKKILIQTDNYLSTK